MQRYRINVLQLLFQFKFASEGRAYLLETVARDTFSILHIIFILNVFSSRDSTVVEDGSQQTPPSRPVLLACQWSPSSFFFLDLVNRYE